MKHGPGSISKNYAPRVSGLLMLPALGLACIAGWLGQVNEGSYLCGVVWLTAMALVVLAAVLHDRQGSDGQNPPQPKLRSLFANWTYREWIAVAAITLLAFALRVYRLDEPLPFLHGDEGELGMRALQALRGDVPEFQGLPLPLFGTSFLDHPTLFNHLQAFALLIGGESIVSLRVLSAVFGAFCVPLIYCVGRLGWGPIAGSVSAWLLAISHLHIHYSRLALNNIQSVWFALLAAALLMTIHQASLPAASSSSKDNRPGGEFLNRRLVPYAALGLSVGLSQYMYYGSRLLIVVLVPVFLLLWNKQKVTAHQLVMFASAAVIAYLPLFFHFVLNPPSFSNRLVGVFILSEKNLTHELGDPYVWWSDVPLLLLSQFEKVGRFFIDIGDSSAFHSPEFPGLDPMTAVLFLLGLGLAIAKHRQFAESMLLTWFLLGALFAGILTNDQPNGPRLIMVVPFAFLFAGIFVQRLSSFGAALGPNFYRVGLLAVGACMGIALYGNLTTYFERYAAMGKNAGLSMIGREVAKGKTEYQFYLLGAPHLDVQHGIFRFIARGAELFNLDNISDLDSLLAKHPANKGLYFIVLPYRIADLELLRQRYHPAIEEEHLDAFKRLLYVGFKISNSNNNLP